MCEQDWKDRTGANREIDTIRALFHDMREPLAAIMLLSASTKGDVDDKLHAISEQAHWLAQLVDLSLDDAASDRLQLVDIRHIAEEVAARARTSTATSIEVKARGGTRAWARPVALSRALACLLDNAVRAAGPDGNAVVCVTDCGSALHVTVQDDGPGLGAIAHRTSLGLTTVRAMVAACHGSFRLASGDNGGAVAEINLATHTIELAVS
jgi:K+-sensing histidine kinase KdpD